MKHIWQWLINILFPPKCIFCRRIIGKKEEYICADCKRDLPYTKKSNVRKLGNFFEECVSPLFYTGRVRESLLRFKFRSAIGYAEYYGILMADCVRQNLSGRYDLITWVPLSDKRKKTRGYNQSQLLAQSMASALGEEAINTLEKVVDIPAQSGIGTEEKRRANVSGAFAVLDRKLVNGRKILLVDDVVTTASTLSECSRQLLMSGAECVCCVTLARTRR